MLTSQIIGPRRSQVVEVADLTPSPTEVLVDVLACGVCASDRRPWRELGTPDSPIRLGHETVGRIAAVGSGSVGWKVGDIVTGLGGNGFSAQALLDTNAILPVPHGIDPALALGEPLAVLVEALGRSGTVLGKRVAIVGLGFMGLGLVQLVRRLAPAILVGIDPNEGARAHGLANGIDEAYHPDALPAAYVDAVDRVHDSRFDLVLEITGVPSGIEVSARLVRPYGTMSIVGYHPAGVPLVDSTLWMKGVTVVNGFSPDRRRTMLAMAEGLDLVARRQFDYAPLITHRFGLDQVDEAYELMHANPADFVKSVIVP